MDTQIETGPTGRRLLPLTVAGAEGPAAAGRPGGNPGLSAASAAGLAGDSRAGLAGDSGAGNGHVAGGVFVGSVSVPGGTPGGGPA